MGALPTEKEVAKTVAQQPTAKTTAHTGTIIFILYTSNNFYENTTVNYCKEKNKGNLQ